MYGFLSEGLGVKTRPCSTNVQCYLRRCEGTNYCVASALGSVASSNNSTKEKPPPLWVRSQGQESKDLGVGTPQDAKNGRCGPFIPHHLAWESQRAWHRPGNKTPEWRPCFRAFPPPLRCATSRSHAPFLSISRTEERRKKPWVSNRGGVSPSRLPPRGLHRRPTPPQACKRESHRNRRFSVIGSAVDRPHRPIQ